MQGLASSDSLVLCPLTLSSLEQLLLCCFCHYPLGYIAKQPQTVCLRQPFNYHHGSRGQKFGQITVRLSSLMRGALVGRPEGWVWGMEVGGHQRQLLLSGIWGSTRAMG